MIKLFTSWIARQLARFGGWLTKKFGEEKETVISTTITYHEDPKAALDALKKVSGEVGCQITPPAKGADEYEWRRALRELISARDRQNAKEQEMWIERELCRIEMAIQSEKPELLTKALRNLLEGLKQDWARARMTGEKSND